MFSCRHSLGFKILDLLAVLSYRVLPWLLLAMAFYWFREIAVIISRGQTGADIWIELMTNVSRTRGFAFVFGFAGIAYGLHQRNVFTAEAARLRQRVTALEQALKHASQ